MITSFFKPKRDRAAGKENSETAAPSQPAKKLKTEAKPKKEKSSEATKLISYLDDNVNSNDASAETWKSALDKHFSSASFQRLSSFVDAERYAMHIHVLPVLLLERLVHIYSPTPRANSNIFRPSFLLLPICILLFQTKTDHLSSPTGHLCRPEFVSSLRDQAGHCRTRSLPRAQPGPRPLLFRSSWNSDPSLPAQHLQGIDERSRGFQFRYHSPTRKSGKMGQTGRPLDQQRLDGPQGPGPQPQKEGMGGLYGCGHPSSRKAGQTLGLFAVGQARHGKGQDGTDWKFQKAHYSVQLAPEPTGSHQDQGALYGQSVFQQGQRGSQRNGARTNRLEGGRAIAIEIVTRENF